MLRVVVSKSSLSRSNQSNLNVTSVLSLSPHIEISTHHVHLTFVSARSTTCSLTKFSIDSPTSTGSSASASRSHTDKYPISWFDSEFSTLHRRIWRPFAQTDDHWTRQLTTRHARDPVHNSASHQHHQRFSHSPHFATSFEIHHGSFDHSFRSTNGSRPQQCFVGSLITTLWLLQHSTSHRLLRLNAT